MKSIAEFLIRVLELLETEGRVARRKVAEIAVLLLLAAGTGFLLVVALLILAGALYLGLANVMAPEFALALVGLLLIVVTISASLVGLSVIREVFKSK